MNLPVDEQYGNTVVVKKNRNPDDSDYDSDYDESEEEDPAPIDPNSRKITVHLALT